MTFENSGNNDDIPLDYGEEIPPSDFSEGHHDDDLDQVGDWDDWTRDHAYSDADMDADATLPLIHNEADFYNAEETTETPKDVADTLEAPKSDLENAMEYMVGARQDAFEAAAAPQRESREPRAEHADDAGQTEISREDGLRIDQEVNLMGYSESLKSAGLTLNPDPILAGFQITDGDKFASTLEALPDTVSPSMRAGLSGAVHNALGYLRAAHTANSTDADFHSYGAPREASKGLEGHGPAHSEKAATEVLAHAGRIGTELERIGAHNDTLDYVTPLWEAKVAEAEGMLPHWALADSWGLYSPPTHSSGDYDWTSWDTEQLGRIDEFLADAAYHAPAGSAFMNRIVAKLHANIELLRQGDFAPGHLPLPPSMKQPKPYYPQRATPEAAAAYDEKLAAIQAQLKSLSGDIQ